MVWLEHTHGVDEQQFYQLKAEAARRNGVREQLLANDTDAGPNLVKKALAV